MAFCFLIRATYDVEDVLRDDVLRRMLEETDDVAVGARARLPVLLGFEEEVEEVALDRVRRVCG